MIEDAPKRFEFVVRGKIFGYRRPRDRGSCYKTYLKFKDRVLCYAMTVGFRRQDEGPTGESYPGYGDGRWSLSVHPAWKGKPRSDWSNVYKSIEDALFSFDRYVTPGRYSDLHFDVGAEDSVKVVVEYMPRSR